MRRNRPDGRFIVNEEDCAGERAGVFPLDPWLNGNRGCSGQENGEGGALSNVTDYGERAFVTADNAEHGSQAESAAQEFRGEERVEDARPDFLGHTRAGVFDFETNVFSGSRSGDGESMVGISVSKRTHSGRNFHGSTRALRDGFAGVDDEVHYHLL